MRIFKEQYNKDKHVYSERIRNDSLDALKPLELKELSESAVIEAANKIYGEENIRMKKTNKSLKNDMDVYASRKIC